MWGDCAAEEDVGNIAFGGGGKTFCVGLTTLWGRLLKDVFKGAAPHYYNPGARFGFI